MMTTPNDGFRGKGAVEQESREQNGNTSLNGQLGHRNEDPLIKAHDTDFPEPGENPEHTGELIMDADRDTAPDKERKPQDQEEPAETVQQDPGERQKRNQNQEKDDPLAA